MYERTTGVLTLVFCGWLAGICCGPRRTTEPVGNERAIHSDDAPTGAVEPESSGGATESAGGRPAVEARARAESDGPPVCSKQWKEAEWPKIEKRQAERVRRCAVMHCESNGDVILQRLRKEHGRLTRVCYEMYLRQNPVVSGRVTWKLVVDRHGCLADPEIAELTLDSPGDPDAERQLRTHLQRCVLERTRHRLYPAPDGGPIEITLPLRLSSE